MPFLNDEPLDPRYDPMRQWLANLERIDVPTLMIQGGSDYCDELTAYRMLQADSLETSTPPPRP